MKAIIRTKAGAEFQTMKVMEISSSEALKHQIKVKMASSRVNPADMDLMKGMPLLRYKNPQIGGIDGAGVVVNCGAEVRGYKAGDAVFFYRKFSDIGTWGEEIVIDAKDVAKVPSTMSVVEAGSIALPLLTAFDSLMQLGTKPGETILIHGAGGGVGFQAVQLAIGLGLKVIATGAPSDMVLLKEIGVERVINFREEDFAAVLSPGEVDYVFDVIGKEVLVKSLELKPRKVISLHFIEPEKLSRTGVQMPGLLLWIMRMMMGKFRRLAAKNGVQLIGQITGADGAMLQRASDFIARLNYRVRPAVTRTLADVEAKGMSKEDLGKVILF